MYHRNISKDAFLNLSVSSVLLSVFERSFSGIKIINNNYLRPDMTRERVFKLSIFNIERDIN